MTAVKLYDLGTGHVETLTEKETEAEAEIYLHAYLAQDKETDHVLYLDEDLSPEPRP